MTHSDDPIHTVVGQRQLFCRYKATQKHASDTVHLRTSIADLNSRFQGSLAHENSEKDAHPTTECCQPSPLHCPQRNAEWRRTANKPEFLDTTLFIPCTGQADLWSHHPNLRYFVRDAHSTRPIRTTVHTGHIQTWRIRSRISSTAHRLAVCLASARIDPH